MTRLIPPLQRIVITGGPGAGKTALLNDLMARGHTVVKESARAIIQDRRCRGLDARPSPLQFAQDILQKDIEKYELTYPGARLAFFDRSIFDALGMLNEISPLSLTDLSNWIVQYPYHRTAFFLPPWREIYQNDEERDQTFAEAVDVYVFLKRWYIQCGFDIADVPALPVAERCNFVLKVIEKSDDEI